MQRALLIALTLLCLFVSVACASESGSTSFDGSLSLKVLNLDSFHESPSGPCLPLVPGSTHQRMTIVTKSGLEYENWSLDTVSSDRLSSGVTLGSCVLYKHVHYEITLQ